MTDVKMLPKDFLAGMKELLGKEYDQYIKSYEEEWKPGLRVNTLKLSPEEFLEFSPWKLSPVPWTGHPDILPILQGCTTFRNPAP